MKRLPPLNALRAFAVAAQAGSFTQAGEALHVTQGAISRQIKQLETSLGVALFERLHQRVELTPVGRELANSLQRALEDMEQAVEKAVGPQPRQTLRLNVPPTFATRWLAPRVSDFRRKYPQFDLFITTDPLGSLRDAQGHDALVVFGNHPQFERPSEQIWLEHHIMVSSPTLWKGKRPPVLETATLLHILDGDRRIPVWERWLALHGPRSVDARPGLNFSTLDQAINAAVAGAGVVIVDEVMIARELQNGSLRRHHDLTMDGPDGYWLVEVNRKVQALARTAAFHQWVSEQIL